MQRFAVVMLLLLVAGFVFLLVRPRPDARGPVVLAAASLQPALEAVVHGWVAKGRPRPVLSFAATSALARQVESGAPADLFLSADEDWADYLEAHGRAEPNSRSDLLANRLALVAGKGQPCVGAIGPGALRQTLRSCLGESGTDGRLAVADPDAVPAGKYAKAALTALGLWQGVKDRLAAAENVRAALAMVERGQAPIGIVYETDARGSEKASTIALLPASSHPPIHYPMLTIRDASHPDTAAFRAFLQSDEAMAIFRRYGFASP